MKIKNIVTVLLIAFILASCVPAVKVVPTETAVPISTVTPLPPTPTITPTPAPENIADTKDLLIWVDEFVHAYGGYVIVNGVEMDTSQLTDKIRKNGEAFTQVKDIDGVFYSFLVVNDVPLAMREAEVKWKKVTIQDIARNNKVYVGALFEVYPPDAKRDEIVVQDFNLMIPGVGGWNWIHRKGSDSYDFHCLTKQLLLRRSTICE